MKEKIIRKKRMKDNNLYRIRKVKGSFNIEHSIEFKDNAPPKWEIIGGGVGIDSSEGLTKKEVEKKWKEMEEADNILKVREVRK